MHIFTTKSIAVSIHSFIHFNSGSKAHKQQTEAMT